MFKGVVLLLTFICLNYSNEYNYRFKFVNDYYLDSNTWYTYTYSNSVYDYYVIGNYLDDNTHIHVDFYPYSYYMDSYIITLKGELQYADLNNYIDLFSKMFVGTSPRYTYSKSYITESGYPYIYFAFHSDDTGDISFQFRSYFYSSFAVVFIVLIVLGAILIMAGISMGIAKAMGRSAWEGLACFCIICTLFCCRR